MLVAQSCSENVLVTPRAFFVESGVVPRLLSVTQLCHCHQAYKLALGASAIVSLGASSSRPPPRVLRMKKLQAKPTLSEFGHHSL